MARDLIDSDLVWRLVSACATAKRSTGYVQTLRSRNHRGFNGYRMQMLGEPMPLKNTIRVRFAGLSASDTACDLYNDLAAVRMPGNTVFQVHDEVTREMIRLFTTGLSFGGEVVSIVLDRTKHYREQMAAISMALSPLNDWGFVGEPCPKAKELYHESPHTYHLVLPDRGEIWGCGDKACRKANNYKPVEILARDSPIMSYRQFNLELTNIAILDKKVAMPVWPTLVMGKPEKLDAMPPMSPTIPIKVEADLGKTWGEIAQTELNQRALLPASRATPKSTATGVSNLLEAKNPLKVVEMAETYNMSPDKLSRLVTEEYAHKMVEALFEKFPAIRKYHKQVSEGCHNALITDFETLKITAAKSEDDKRANYEALVAERVKNRERFHDQTNYNVLKITADKILGFLSGLNLQDHAVSEQREQRHFVIALRNALVGVGIGKGG